MGKQGLSSIISWPFGRRIDMYKCGIEFLGDTVYIVHTNELISEYEFVEDNMRMLAHRYKLTPESCNVKYDVIVHKDYRDDLSDVEEVTLVQDFQRFLGLPISRLSLNLHDGTSVNVLKLEPAESGRIDESIFAAY